MRKSDHRHLAGYMTENMRDRMPRRFRLALIIGNVEPDVNFFTYFHGFFGKNMFRGHNYDNIMPSLSRLVCKLERRSIKRGGAVRTKDYYTLGKCMHYLADIFTYPHNSEFPGSMADHCRYEDALHERMSEIFDAHRKFYCIDESRDAGNFWGEMMKLHEAYAAMRNEDHSIDQDCRYILTVTRMLAIAYVAPVWERIVRGKTSVSPFENLLLLSIPRPATRTA